MINCPKCSAEVVFDPEASGPDGKVKVVCGSCGARFAVKVNRPALKLGGAPAASFARKQEVPSAARPSSAAALSWDHLLKAAGIDRSSEELPLLATLDVLPGPAVPVGIVSHARKIPAADLEHLNDDPGLFHTSAHAFLRARASQLGAQAVVGVRTSTVWRESEQDFLVLVEGTAVRFA